MRALLLAAAGSLLCVLAVANGADTQDLIGRRPFTDSRDPPSFTDLDPAVKARVELGHAVFNTQWVPAGTPGAGRRDGLGPLFNAAACDACHNEGAHGRGPAGDGVVPATLVIQLESPRTPRNRDDLGDPRYGHVLNASALDGIAPEGIVTVRYSPRDGQYPDGVPWTLRVPRYEISGLNYGPLARSTVVKPRLAPALFGAGLLEAVPAAALCGSKNCLKSGRFGWTGAARSVRDQTTKAFAREMGITSRDVPADDCTPAEAACRRQPNGGVPEVSDELLEAVVAFQRWLAVPERAPTSEGGPAAERLFEEVGCATCHRPRLPVTWTDDPAHPDTGTIDPYTDLEIHDLGTGLADVTVDGTTVATRWRTAPLWGLGYRLQREREPTFMHDGRGRSVEEAILWHDGEAAASRQAFEGLPVTRREALLRWLASL